MAMSARRHPMPLWLEMAFKLVVLGLVLGLVLIRVWLILVPGEPVMDRDGSYCGWLPPGDD